MNEKDISKYYKILGLEIGATHEEVKEAYHDLVKVWHPDRFLNDANLQVKTQEKLIQINDAYNHLRHYFSRQKRLLQPDQDREKEQPPKKTIVSATAKQGKIRFKKIKKVKEPKEPSNVILYTTGIGTFIILIFAFLAISHC